MPMHISARHRGMILAEFRRNPVMVEHYFMTEGRFLPDQLMLPAPNALTVYSRRPLGFMAAPIPELRRPKGYCPGYGYARPADALCGQLRLNRPIY
jgi:hypothetical protein